MLPLVLVLLNAVKSLIIIQAIDYAFFVRLKKNCRK